MSGKAPPRLETLSPRLLTGICREMSRTNDETSMLWRDFGPRRSEVRNRVNADSISMQVYPELAEQVLDPEAEFQKWAAVEVSSHESVPDGMETYVIEGGLYAVFTHTGPATDLSTYMFIYSEWLPASGYELEHREHFEVLPEDYNPFDPNAREEIWIPVRRGGRS